jgi:hypothetical protein
VTGCATRRWIERGWRIRSAHPMCRGSTRTSVSGRSRDWRVWSSSREVAKHARLIGRGGTPGHDRPNTSSCVWVLTGIDRTWVLWRPVSSSSMSGRVVSNANQRRPDAATAFGRFDRRVRLVRRQRQLVPSSSISLGLLINTCWPAPRGIPWTFLHSNILLS